MKLLKPLFFSSALAFMAIGCGTANFSKATPITDLSSATKKKAALSEVQLKRWSHLDLLADSIPGMSVDKAYNELLKNRKGSKVIVGVIDSGIDVFHEDLHQVVWKNSKEIAGNKKDDDNNGYVDDIFGWNFLGDAIHENYEFIRVLRRGDDGSAQYKRAQKEFQDKMSEVMANKQQVDYLLSLDSTLKTHLKKDNYTLEDLKAITSTDEKVVEAKNLMENVLSRGSKEAFDKRMDNFSKYVNTQLNYHFNKDYNGRILTGDNPNDINDTNYGDNNVVGKVLDEAKHGTHVAGIIAQSRHNNLGGDGVANNVEIMTLRAVPDGDEYDKDIALAIRYAVDNGAKVINGSFGKYYSQNEKWVWDAMKYAEEKDVLIIIAAGNDTYDLDVVNKYPNDSYNNSPEITNNVVIVGALNYEYSEKLMATFSNYGKQNVDVFAPGVKIYATTPGNTYEYLQGTSMASPNVAGVAALIRSQFPKLTAAQVKNILMESSLKPNINVEIFDEETGKKIVKPFAEISKSGGMVNAYNALILASKMSK